MRYCALASGSNGNCYYIAEGNNAVLVDIGINTKHVEQRMANVGIDPASVKAIFITHEHTDHIRGVSVFSKRYQIPVYMTAGSYRGSRLKLPENLIRIIRRDDEIVVGGLTIRGIPKYHDAQEPCSFLVSNGDINIGVLTDIGRICDNIKQVIQKVDVLLLETNYDEELLDRGSYPFFLKNRIRNGLGHLSNRMALETFLEYRTSRLQHLILGHLSGQNNTVELVQQAFSLYCKDIRLSIATRCQETELFDSQFFSSKSTKEIFVRQLSCQGTIVFPES
ncbi:MBL fold metallo-hydrolase [Sphingobacterium haloxyli]|uniref:MBL fold metallo-hydrolase n=1 Tax=Sphingobacterium haloxyli TaxID=2100533 RepID=A0A2S9IX01_9SPHI|nr:MBL fold metallo-hydrolase [Sphingobacterium haloxyli]PRD45049.1 MBL fold metallo-hydrolase [Sphingobacterium haloxyli]